MHIEQGPGGPILKLSGTKFDRKLASHSPIVGLDFLPSPPFYKGLTAHKWGAAAAPGLSWAHVLSHPVANFAPESLEIGRPGPGSICTDCQPRRPPWGEFSSPVTDK